MGETAEEVKEEGPRSFTVFLRDLSEGEAEGELSYRLHELTKRIQEEMHLRNAAAKGKLTLTIDIVAEPPNIANVRYDISVKEPKSRTSPAIRWLTKGGNLTVENQKQQKLPLREVKADERSARDVQAPAAAKEV